MQGLGFRFWGVEFHRAASPCLGQRALFRETSALGLPSMLHLCMLILTQSPHPVGLQRFFQGLHPVLPGVCHSYWPWTKTRKETLGLLH